MNARITPSIAATAAAAVVAAATSGVAAAAPAVAAPQGVANRAVTIVMHDPGCHWFSVGGVRKAKLVVNGTTAFRNKDEATLVFAGNGFSKRVPVGASVTVAKRGVYHITMVGQQPDDNHLLLVVK